VIYQKVFSKRVNQHDQSERPKFLAAECLWPRLTSSNVISLLPTLIPLNVEHCLTATLPSVAFKEQRAGTELNPDNRNPGITKMAVFWVVAPCSLVEVYQRFRGPCCLHHQGDRYNPEDSHLRTHRRENLKSYLESLLFSAKHFIYLRFEVLTAVKM
jgi:hypothetical protein